MKLKKIIQKYFSKKETHTTPKELYDLNSENSPKGIDYTLDVLEKTKNYHDAAKLALANGLTKNVIRYGEKMGFEKSNLGMFYDTVKPKLKIQKDLTEKVLLSSRTERTKFFNEKINFN